MWKDDDGITHSIALPDPTTAMTARTLAGLEALSVHERRRAFASLMDYFSADRAEGHLDTVPASDLGPVDTPLPNGYIDAAIRSAEDVMDVVRSAEPAWRHDVGEVLLDYIDSTRADRDLELVPVAVKQAAKVEPWGSVLWPHDHAVAAVQALATAGFIVSALSVRTYDEDGEYVEIDWSLYRGDDPAEGRDHALTALRREDVPAGWILVRWE